MPETNEFGYSVFGPLLFEFNRWLYQEAVAKKVDQLFFLAREGWFLRELYQEYVRLLSLEDAPPDSYLLASRRALFGTAKKDEHVLRYAMSHAHYNGKLFDLAQTRIGAQREDLDSAGIEDITLQLPRETENAVQALLPALKALNEQADRERAAYLAYLNSVDFFEGERIGIVDLGYSGTIQRFLYALTKRPMGGFYAAARERTREWTTASNDLSTCFGMAEDHNDDMPIMRFALYLEGWLTSPVGQLVSFVQEGDEIKPVFGPPGRMQESFHLAKAVCDSVKAYFKDAVAIGVGTRLDPSPLGPNTQYLMDALLRSGVYDRKAAFMVVEDVFCNMGEIEVASHYRSVLEAEARARR